MRSRNWRALLPDCPPILLVFLLILVARVLGIISVYFFEEDEASIAIGAASLVAHSGGGLYRYTVQAGYYRLVELIDLMLGGRISLIPAIMKGLSALAGAVIPAMGFLAFRRELTTRERWLAVFALTVTPIIWRSSQYGNTATVAAALATVAVVVLSNRPGWLAQTAALASFGLATLVRADTVLVVPVLLFLLYRNSRTWIVALKWSAAFGLTMLLIYALILLVDPRADNPLQSVATHMSIDRPTLFWEYLLWAMSPVLMMFGLWGIRNLIDSRPSLFGVLLLWCLPTLLFYFQATTTARYFLNAAVPLAIAAAIGMAELVDRLERRVRAVTAWTVTVGLATIHLVIALGHVPPNHRVELLYGGTFTTDDGPMPTGALLVRTYLTSGSLLRALPYPKFGQQSYPYWEGPAYRKAIALLSDPAAPKRTVIILLWGGYGHAFLYHAHELGARFLVPPPKGDLIWEGPNWFELGNTRVMTVAAYRPVAHFDVVAGDQIWTLDEKPFPDDGTPARMPPGLTLTPIPSFDGHFKTFEVISRLPSR